jgi:type III secretion protein S
MDYNVIYIAKQALMVSFILSLPVILIASIVGLLFSIFQALTQIQDQTLSFAIKLFAVIVTLSVSSSWMASKLYRFAISLYSFY